MSANSCVAAREGNRAAPGVGSGEEVVKIPTLNRTWGTRAKINLGGTSISAMNDNDKVVHFLTVGVVERLVVKEDEGVVRCQVVSPVGVDPIPLRALRLVVCLPPRHRFVETHDLLETFGVIWICEL